MHKNGPSCVETLKIKKNDIFISKTPISNSSGILGPQIIKFKEKSTQILKFTLNILGTTKLAPQYQNELLALISRGFIQVGTENAPNLKQNELWDPKIQPNGPRRTEF